MYDKGADSKLRRKQERAAAHPIREAILHLLGDRRELPTTAICHELPGCSSLSVVGYHVRVLQDAEMVQADGSVAVPVYSLV